MPAWSAQRAESFRFTNFVLGVADGNVLCPYLETWARQTAVRVETNPWDPGLLTRPMPNVQPKRKEKKNFQIIWFNWCAEIFVWPLKSCYWTTAGQTFWIAKPCQRLCPPPPKKNQKTQSVSKEFLLHLPDWNPPCHPWPGDKRSSTQSRVQSCSWVSVSVQLPPSSTFSWTEFLHTDTDISNMD